MRLNDRQWKTFHLYDLFKIDSGNKFDRSKMTFSMPKVNFVGRTRVSNGVTALVDEVSGIKPYESGNLTVALGGSYLGSCFLQEKPFYTSQNVNVLIPLDSAMTKETKLFISHLIRFECINNYQAFARELNAHIRKDFTIKLPVNDEDKPDTKFIENYVKGLKTDISTIPDYFLDEGYTKACWYMDNINPREFEAEYAGSVITNKLRLNIKDWKSYKVSDIFIIRNGKGITQQEILENEGDFPAIQSGEANNGIMGYIDKDYCKEQGYIYTEKPCLTVARTGSAGYVSFQENGCCVGDSAKILEPKDIKTANAYVLLFIKTILMANKYRYLYARKVTAENYAEEKIMLPAKNENPDYEFMEEYIKSLNFSVAIANRDSDIAI